jgi:hypothetical protein
MQSSGDPECEVWCKRWLFIALCLCRCPGCAGGVFLEPALGASHVVQNKLACVRKAHSKPACQSRSHRHRQAFDRTNQSPHVAASIRHSPPAAAATVGTETGTSLTLPLAAPTSLFVCPNVCALFQFKVAEAHTTTTVSALNEVSQGSGHGLIYGACRPRCPMLCISWVAVCFPSDLAPTLRMQSRLPTRGHSSSSPQLISS